MAASRPDLHVAPGFGTGARAPPCARAAGVPTVLQGSVVDPAAAQAALDAGVADLVEMTRAQIADPDLVAHVRAGRPERIRPCTLSNQRTAVRDPRNPLVSDDAEPSAGHELDDDRPPPTDPRPRPALVVGRRARGPGGGPRPWPCAGTGCGWSSGRRCWAGRCAGRPRCTGAARMGVLVAVVGRRAAPARGAGGAGHGDDGGRPGRDRAGRDRRRAGHRVAAGAAGVPVGPAGRGGGGVRGRRPGRRLDVRGARGSPAGSGKPRSGTRGQQRGFPEPRGRCWCSTRSATAPASGSPSRSRRPGGRPSLVTPDQVAGTQLARTGDLAPAGVRLARAGVVRELRSTVREVVDGRAVLEHVWTGERRTTDCALVIDCGHRLPADALWRARPHLARAGDCVAPRTLYEAVLEGRRAAVLGGADALTRLAEPLRLGPLRLRNRVVFSAHLTNAAVDGLATDQHAAYYAARAAGGAGLVITEEHSVHPDDQPYEKLIRGWRPRRRARLPARSPTPSTPTARRCSPSSTTTAASPAACTRASRCWAPSPLADPMFREVPSEITAAGIAELVEGYALVGAALRRRRLRRRRAAVLARLDPAPVPVPADQPPHRRLRRPAGEPRPRGRAKRWSRCAPRSGPTGSLGVRLCGDEGIPGGTTLDELVRTARLAGTARRLRQHLDRRRHRDPAPDRGLDARRPRLRARTSRRRCGARWRCRWSGWGGSPRWSTPSGPSPTATATWSASSAARSPTPPSPPPSPAQLTPRAQPPRPVAGKSPSGPQGS